MNKKIIVIVLIIVAVVLLLINSKKAEGAPEEFAKCVADAGATMYGAEWCPHCKDQRRDFGKSFELIPYVECPENTKMCIAKDIQGYPTWIFKDGQKIAGRMDLEKIGEITGCNLEIK